MKRVSVRAEPSGFSVWLLVEDPMLVSLHPRQGAAHACAQTVARKGGCGGASVCKGCSVDQEAIAALRAS